MEDTRRSRKDLKKYHADSWPSRMSLPASPKIIKTTEDDTEGNSSSDVFDYCQLSSQASSSVQYEYDAISPRFERKRNIRLWFDSVN